MKLNDKSKNNLKDLAHLFKPTKVRYTRSRLSIQERIDIMKFCSDNKKRLISNHFNDFSGNLNKAKNSLINTDVIDLNRKVFFQKINTYFSKKHYSKEYLKKIALLLHSKDPNYSLKRKNIKQTIYSLDKNANLYLTLPEDFYKSVNNKINRSLKEKNNSGIKDFEENDYYSNEENSVIVSRFASADNANSNYNDQMDILNEDINRRSVDMHEVKNKLVKFNEEKSNNSEYRNNLKKAASKNYDTSIVNISSNFESKRESNSNILIYKRKEKERDREMNNNNNQSSNIDYSNTYIKENIIKNIEVNESPVNKFKDNNDKNNANTITNTNNMNFTEKEVFMLRKFSSLNQITNLNKILKYPSNSSITSNNAKIPNAYKRKSLKNFTLFEEELTKALKTNDIIEKLNKAHVNSLLSKQNINKEKKYELEDIKELVSQINLPDKFFKHLSSNHNNSSLLNQLITNKQAKPHNIVSKVNINIFAKKKDEKELISELQRRQILDNNKLRLLKENIPSFFEKNELLEDSKEDKIITKKEIMEARSNKKNSKLSNYNKLINNDDADILDNSSEVSHKNIRKEKILFQKIDETYMKNNIGMIIKRGNINNNENMNKIFMSKDIGRETERIISISNSNNNNWNNVNNNDSGFHNRTLKRNTVCNGTILINSFNNNIKSKRFMNNNNNNNNNEDSQDLSNIKENNSNEINDNEKDENSTIDENIKKNINRNSIVMKRMSLAKNNLLKDINYKKMATNVNIAINSLNLGDTHRKSNNFNISSKRNESTINSKDTQDQILYNNNYSDFYYQKKKPKLKSLDYKTIKDNFIINKRASNKHTYKSIDLNTVKIEKNIRSKFNQSQNNSVVSKNNKTLIDRLIEEEENKFPIMSVNQSNHISEEYKNYLFNNGKEILNIRKMLEHNRVLKENKKSMDITNSNNKKESSTSLSKLLNKNDDKDKSINNPYKKVTISELIQAKSTNKNNVEYDAKIINIINSYELRRIRNLNKLRKLIVGNSRGKDLALSKKVSQSLIMGK